MDVLASKSMDPKIGQLPIRSHRSPLIKERRALLFLLFLSCGAAMLLFILHMLNGAALMPF